MGKGHWGQYVAQPTPKPQALERKEEEISVLHIHGQLRDTGDTDGIVTYGITAFSQTATSPDEWEGDHGHWGTTVGMPIIIYHRTLFTYLFN